MVIIGQNDAATGTNRLDHRLDHGQRVGNMLEQKPRVRDIKRTPLLASERKAEGVARSHLHDIGFAVLGRLFPRLGELVEVALDSQNARAAGPATLAIARVNWASPLPTSRMFSPALKVQLAQRRLIE